MRICFIADSSSIHVQRIVSYFIRQKDEVLILSSAPEMAEIPGAKTVYLLDVNSMTPIPSEACNRPNRVANHLKSFVSDSFKSLVNFILDSIHVLSKRAICLEAIERFDPEVIYCFRSFPEGALGSYCHVRPLLLRTAGPDISLFPKYPVFRQVTRHALRSADVLVTESYWERQLLQKLCGASVDPEVAVIGIDTSLFRPASSRSFFRSKYNLPQDAFVVVTNRYLDGWHNGWQVVEAIQTILKQCPNLVLLYATPAAMSTRTKAKVDSTILRFPRIKFLDGPFPHREVADILACGDLYISFSSFDGIPNSLLEAMACGLVPIVAELPQLHEWIDHNLSGYFVPQHDVKSLASIVKVLYDNPQQLAFMSSHCIDKVREQASYEFCMERTRNSLKLISSNSSPTCSINKLPISPFPMD
jgi:glycosyltransferase involved in cell wall biosynthesis